MCWLLLTQAPTTQSLADRAPHLSSEADAKPARFSVEGRFASLAMRYRCVRADDRCSLYLEGDDGTPMLVAADHQLLYYDAFNRKLVHVAECGFIWELRIDEERALKFKFSFKTANRDGKLSGDQITVDLPSFVNGAEMLEPLADGWWRASSVGPQGGKMLTELNPDTPAVVRRIDVQVPEGAGKTVFTLRNLVVGQNVADEQCNFLPPDALHGLDIVEQTFDDEATMRAFISEFIRSLTFRAALADRSFRSDFDKTIDEPQWEALAEAEKPLAEQLRAIPEVGAVRRIKTSD